MEYFASAPRRWRDRTAEADIKKQVPAQLIFPDGNWSLGIPNFHMRQNEDAQEDDMFNGPFVVWSDPSSEMFIGRHKFSSIAFYVIFILNFMTTVAMFAYTLAKNKQYTRILMDRNLSPSAVVSIFFALTIAIKLIGAVGVYFEHVRMLTLCMSCGLFIFFVELIWLGSLLDLGRLAIDLFFLFWIFRIRSALLGQWFSTMRLRSGL